MTRPGLLILLILCFSTPNLKAQFFLPDSTDRMEAPPPSQSLLQADVPLETEPFWTTEEVNVNSTGLVFDDCNRDGYIDAFISNGNDIVRVPNAVYLSDQGTLPTSASWYSGNSEYSGHSAVGDINDDGWPDWVVANFLGSGRFSTPNLLNLYYNVEGTLNTSPDWYSADSAFTFSCALGDVDNDGDLDLAIATGTGYTDTYTTDRLYLNVGGVFESLPSWQSQELTAAMDVTWGDVDNDGDLDLALCYDYLGAAVYINEGGVLSGSPGWQSSHAQSANTIIFGDVNGDDWLDLIVAFNSQLGGGGYFRVYFNDGSGNLAVDPGWESDTWGYGSALALYDYDADGDDDLAAGRWFHPVLVYENTGTTFTPTPVWQSEPSVVAEELAWADIDGSTVEELADTIAANGNCRLFYLDHHPLYSIDSVLVDNNILDHPDFCFDLVSGWVSLASAPADSAVVYYKYSFSNDLAVSDWDDLNMAFANTFHRIDMYADPARGWAPLEVQFSDSSAATSGWLWSFGDGTTSEEKDPVHTYDEAGAYDVSLEVLFPEGWYERTRGNMIIVLADTIIGDQVVDTAGSSVEMVVYGRNNFPTEYIRVPFEYSGDLAVTYDSFSTVGCRTEYFQVQDYLHYDPFFGKRITLRLETSTNGSAPELPPGAGPIVKIYFTISAAASPGQTVMVQLDGYDTYQPAFIGSITDVEPADVAGSIQVACCEDIRGNIDGDLAETIDVNDVQYFIDWMFSGGPSPMCLDEVDCDGSGRIDIDDLLALIDYVYRSGPPPTECN